MYPCRDDIFHATYEPFRPRQHSPLGTLPVPPSQRTHQPAAPKPHISRLPHGWVQCYGGGLFGAGPTVEDACAAWRDMVMWNHGEGTNR